MLFKKKEIYSKIEDDDYKHVSNENNIESSTNVLSASIKNENSSKLTTKDKKVRCLKMVFSTI